MIEVQYKKHVRLICDLSIGEEIMMKDFHYKVNGKQKILDIVHSNNCESGFLVKITNYDSMIDSGWIEKLEGER